MKNIEYSLSLESLSEDEKKSINGGNPLVVAAGVATGLGIVWTTFHSIGENIGKAIYHATH